MRSLKGGAWLLVVAMVVAACTDDGDSTTEPSSSTTSLAPVGIATVPATGAAGEALEVVMGGPVPEWRQVLDLGGDGFTTMLAAGSGIWAIAGDRNEPSALWHSVDGGSWTELDTTALLGEGAIVSEITDGGPGLVAVGLLPSGATLEAVAWTSTDGGEWAVSPLGYKIPENERPFEATVLDFLQVAPGPSGAVIAASVWEGVDHDQLDSHVVAAVPDGLREYADSYLVTSYPFQIAVSVGPFEVFSEEVENQDLVAAHERTTDAGSPRHTIMFVTDDFETWQQVDEWPGGDDLVVAMTATADGYLADTWFWGNSSGPFESVDGLVWAKAELPAGRGTWFATHDGRLLMLGDLGGRATVWESNDGGATWTPRAGLPNNAGDVRVGGFGLVAWGEYESDSLSSPEWPPTIIERDGLTLSITVGPGGLVLSEADGATVLTAEVSTGSAGWRLELPPAVRADNDKGLFTVVEPESGQALMEVPYREMEDAFEKAQRQTDNGPTFFVAHSADGRVWSEQSIPHVTLMSGSIGPLVVGDDFAVMVVNGLDDGASVWRASIP